MILSLHVQAQAVVQQLKPGGELWATIRQCLSDQARTDFRMHMLCMFCN